MLVAKVFLNNIDSTYTTTKYTQNNRNKYYKGNDTVSVSIVLSPNSVKHTVIKPIDPILKL